MVSTDTANSGPMVFVLPGTPEDWGMDSALLQSHGAAGQWDYLFQDDTGAQNTYQGNMSDSTPTSSSSKDNTNVIVDKDSFWPATLPVDDSELQQVLGTGTAAISTGGVFTGTMQIDAWNASTDSVIQQSGNTQVISLAKNCTTPWGEVVPHKDFVLAYEQRTDVNNLCNIQKRYCFNGKLTGSYKQKSCKQDEVYSYTQEDPVAYNNQKVDPLIQPDKAALSGASFDVHGKINTTETAIDTWPDGKSTGQPTIVTSVNQTPTDKRYCTTAWGEKIKNGQFIKAYKSSIGLIDMPCEVELRLCVDGTLKGHYTNRTCLVKNMTYRDYLVGNSDLNTPTASDLFNAVDTEEQKNKLNSSSFWTWLSQHF